MSAVYNISEIKPYYQCPTFEARKTVQTPFSRLPVSAERSPTAAWRGRLLPPFFDPGPPGPAVHF
jgi:hypothetical protein